MPRRHGRHRAAAPALDGPPPDYGPGFRRRDARLEPVTQLAAAANIMLAEIPDVDHPDRRGAVTRVALRDDPLWLLLGAERIGDGRVVWANRNNAAKHYAAEKLRDDSAKAEGLRSEDRMMMVGFAAMPGGVPQMMLDAQARCRKAWLAVRGAENDAWIADAVRVVVLGRAALSAVEARQHCRYATARDRLMTGLERLADHYGLD